MSDSSGNWFSRKFKKNSQPEPKRDPGAAPRPTPHQDLQPGAAFKKMDFRGNKYEILGIIGKGGFGVVYMLYSRENGKAYAMKTFQDRYLADAETRERFHKEASVWVDLGNHPYLVCAHVVLIREGRLYIVMENIAPNEQGLNSLDGYLDRQPPDLAQSLRWAIQVCRGMEYAYSKGVRAHRDLKPANIMIGQDKVAKITDFGLATALGAGLDKGASSFGYAQDIPPLAGGGEEDRPILSLFLSEGKRVCGTPGYIPPELFRGESADEQSDIYSFGVVLWQMAVGSRWPPFFKELFRGDVREYQQAVYQRQPQVSGPLQAVVGRCLEKLLENRYQTFTEVRKDLEPLLQHQTGEVINPPQLKDLDSQEWKNKGVSFDNLGRHEEAIRCYDKALELDPIEAGVWYNKGISLENLGRHEEAIRCYDKALELDHSRIDTWYNKGCSLDSLSRYEEAIRCYDKALELDHSRIDTWFAKGCSLSNLSRHEEALHCYDKTLELDKRFSDGWNNKGIDLLSLCRYQEAINCYDKALELNPTLYSAFFGKASAEEKLGHFKEAVHSYEQFLEFAPPQHALLQIAAARKRLLKLAEK